MLGGRRNSVFLRRGLRRLYKKDVTLRNIFFFCSRNTRIIYQLVDFCRRNFNLTLLGDESDFTCIKVKVVHVFIVICLGFTIVIYVSLGHWPPSINHAYFFLFSLVAMTIILCPLLRIQLDKRINTHDADASLYGTFELPHFADAGL